MFAIFNDNDRFYYEFVHIKHKTEYLVYLNVQKVYLAGK